MNRRLRRLRRVHFRSSWENSTDGSGCEEEDEKNKENTGWPPIVLRDVTVNLGVKVDYHEHFDFCTKDQYSGYKLTKITVDLGERVDSNWKGGIKAAKIQKVTKRRSGRKQRTYLCKNCSKSFSSKNHLEIHLADHRSERYICGVCGLRFPLKRRVDTHMAEHQQTVNK
ncbi:zinc finger protein 175-like [Centruroides sculpturatus]|uniref:zinc finger protein 175-like n=1 Tax=Centruroides sculpturatus TaxID=218467 RepID=UPI000C6CF7CC|nr:zinc finger protein 175-like [Centruroides sculpturatus]